MNDFDVMLSMNRAANGRVVVYLLFAMNAVCLLHFGGSASLLGMVLATVSVAAAYLFEAAYPKAAEAVAVASAIGAALCVAPHLF